MKLVSTLALAAVMTIGAATTANADDHGNDGVPGPDEDPYIWLEEARSDEALAWVEAENERTLGVLEADPRFDTLKAEALAIFDSEDRIPFVSFRPDGLYNFWQDKDNPEGPAQTHEHRELSVRRSHMGNHTRRRRSGSG